MQKNKKERLFVEKKLLLATWGCEVKNHHQCRDWIPFFKKNFGKLTVFSPRTNYFREGIDIMNKKLLNLVSKEKPDYIIFSMSYDEFYIDTLLKIREISPNSVLIHFFSDDEWRFDDWSRYYALFFDYNLTPQLNNSYYKKDGIKNAMFLHGSSSTYLKPLNIKKKYDVAFMGVPISDRYEYIKFLHQNNINIRVFGLGWEKYPDLKEIYGGYLDAEEYIKAINQTKINLSFSKGLIPGSRGGQLKGRLFDVAGCNAFCLTEYSPDNIGIFKSNQKINFKSKKELLKKINYFLENEKEREKISGKSYKDFILKYNWEVQFERFFNSISKSGKLKSNSQILPKSVGKIATIYGSDFLLDNKEIIKKTENRDYINFSVGKAINSKYKGYFQAYSLEKSRKPVSCCDYYLYSKKLGEYMLFTSKKAFKKLSNEKFINLLDINQLAVSKAFFIKNINKFRDLSEGKIQHIINKDNTVFISIPLIKIKKYLKGDYQAIKEAFQMRFRDKLYSLVQQKKIILNTYPYLLILKSLSGEDYILKFLIESIFNKENWYRLKNKF